MSATYTYWKTADGWFVGYWDDYPAFSTQGRTLDELKFMLRDLRGGIAEMVAAGEMPAAGGRMAGVMEFA